jgi:hypothetical protein
MRCGFPGCCPDSYFDINNLRGNTCERDRMSERGFSLPEGDPVAGRDTFIYMQCHQCHYIEGEQFPVLPGMDPPYVELGSCEVIR